VVAKPTPYKFCPITQGFLGDKVAKEQKLQRPYTRDSLCDFFTRLTDVYDRVAKMRCVRIPKQTRVRVVGSSRDRPLSTYAISGSHKSAKLSADDYYFIAELVLLDKPSVEIRQLLLSDRGITVSPSHMSHIRRRLFGPHSKDCTRKATHE
jgi:hypothetical protein